MTQLKRAMRGQARPLSGRTVSTLSLIRATVLGVAALFAGCTSQPAPAPEPPAAQVAPLPPPQQNPIFEDHLKPGQTLSQVLEAYKLPVGTTHEVVNALSSLVDMRKLRPGNAYRLELTPDGDFQAFSYYLSSEQRYKVEAVEGGVKATKEEVAVESRPTVISGSIRTTLYDAVLDAGENIAFAMGLIDAFQWDINFYSDTQPGDQYKALVERVYVDGKPDRIGKVLYARYDGRSVGTKEAVAFRDEFFDSSGKYLQKSFLTTPLNVLKITSRFGQRFHPILGILRAHRGLDYGARRGTPVWSVADGRVVVAGNRGDGFGNQVLIEHVSGYQSRYAHLSRVSLAVGQRVKQKMKVGEVGSTGLASGPHLHFEILVNGKQVNPARMKMLPTVTRTVKDLPAFMAERTRLMQLMNSVEVAVSHPEAAEDDLEAIAN